jgi:hypothetical protein
MVGYYNLFSDLPFLFLECLEWHDGGCQLFIKDQSLDSSIAGQKSGLGL